ncbi:cytochrome P450 [Streptomyces sp. NPDC087212]|uniref:cytochrome P450 n=1 Tax=Streptomyces sp. NPDC087212 TaxID=3365766 RepID=UPI00382FFC5F
MTATPPTPELDVLARLMNPDTLQDPYPFYTWLREHAPVHRNPTGGVYLVSSNEAARNAYQSPDLRSIETEELPAKHPRWHRSRALRLLTQVITSTNAPEHTRLRRAVSRHFTLRQAQRLQTAAKRHCDRLLTPLATRLKDGETADLHHDLTQPLGMNMAGDIIGIPEPDREPLTALILQVLASIHPTSDDDTLEAGNTASEQVEDYFTQLAAERRDRPTEDLISALLTDVTDGDEKPEQGLNHTEFMVMLWGLWAGSFETTVASMDFGVLALLDHPDQATWLDAGPAETKAFVAETLRHSPPVLVDAVPRIARKDIHLGGITIPEGADVRTLHGAANRDPQAFPDPDRFDPARNTSRMVTFGHGIHHCLGANLARMECAVALSHIRRTLPGLTLPARPLLRTAMSLRTFENFPVTL